MKKTVGTWLLLTATALIPTLSLGAGICRSYSPEYDWRFPPATPGSTETTDENAQISYDENCNITKVVTPTFTYDGARSGVIVPGKSIHISTHAGWTINNVSAQCSDGIQNQKETGVDCGGPCPECE
jgi:hypothetical protein